MQLAAWFHGPVIWKQHTILWSEFVRKTDNERDVNLSEGINVALQIQRSTYHTEVHTSLFPDFAIRQDTRHSTATVLPGNEREILSQNTFRHSDNIKLYSRTYPYLIQASSLNVAPPSISAMASVMEICASLNIFSILILISLLAPSKSGTLAASPTASSCRFRSNIRDC